MTRPVDAHVREWLSSPGHPPVQYLVARDVTRPELPPSALAELRVAMLDWEPLARVLELQRDDGSFPHHQKTPTAQPSFTALCLMQRCGMDLTDEPVARLAGHLTDHHLHAGALSYTSGGSGVLPCYVGVVATALIKMGGLDTELVQSSIRWLVEHQRFDHKAMRAGGDSEWPFRAPVNYGCWASVSCYHGVAGAFRALAAIPAHARTPEVQVRLDEAIDYLALHRLYKPSSSDRPLFRHMTQPFLVGDYRSDLLDMLSAVADADPALGQTDWVQSAVADMAQLAVDGRVVLTKNYGRKLIDPIPFEAIGEPSRFLTYQWLHVHRTLSAPQG